MWDPINTHYLLSNHSRNKAETIQHKIGKMRKRDIGCKMCLSNWEREGYVCWKMDLWVWKKQRDGVFGEIWSKLGLSSFQGGYLMATLRSIWWLFWSPLYLLNICEYKYSFFPHIILTVALHHALLWQFLPLYFPTF